MGKRGKDHTWEMRRYSGDMAIYGHCSCGYEKAFGSDLQESNEIPCFPYCPICGAKKKWCTEIKRINMNPFEARKSER